MPSPTAGCGAIPRWPGATLPDMLSRQAERIGEQVVYRHLAEDGTEEEQSYATCWARAAATADWLKSAGTAGQPVLVAHPSGLDFPVALFACWMAGAIAVPVPPPRGTRMRARLTAIAHHSQARVVLAHPRDCGFLRGLSLEWVPTATVHDSPPPDGMAQAGPDQPALIQYTSGSTAHPKGVLLSHRNLAANLESLRTLRQAVDIREAVSWLPPHHDMGLVLKILHACEAGFTLSLLAPESFAREPVRWLQAISRHRAQFSAAPNFAYDLCTRTVTEVQKQALDLSCWKVAPCGAERIRPASLRRFADAFAPCGFDPAAFLAAYGLAEATLTVSVSAPGRGLKTSTLPSGGVHASCGPAVARTRIRIVDSVTGRTCPDLAVGEIQVAGPAVAHAYWRDEEATTATFGSDGFLRTGDLGFLHHGELHVTGRIKDCLILDGANHSPDDIEAAATEALAPTCTDAAAFAVDADDGERAVLLLERGLEPSASEDLAALASRVRLAVVEHTGVALATIAFVRRGSLPRTTSGKIRRAAARDAWLAGKLKPLAAKTPRVRQASDEILTILLETTAEITGGASPSADDDLFRLGLASLDATRLAAELSHRLHRVVSLADLFAAPSLEALADQLRGRPTADCRPSFPHAGNHLLSHSQERMWFLHQLDPDSAAYHVFGCLELHGSLDQAILRRSFTALVERHEMLRTCYPSVEGAPQIHVDGNARPELISETCDPAGISARLSSFARAPFDLSRAPLLRAILLEIAPERHVLAVCAHHIVADGWSMRLLAGELASIYQNNGRPPAAPAPTGLAHSTWHRQWIESGAVDDQIRFWQNRLAGHRGILDLPTDFPRPAKHSAAGGSVHTALPTALLDRIRRLATTRRTTPFTVILSAFLVLLRRQAGETEPVVAVPVANRNHPGTSSVVGTFVNTLPFRSPPPLDDSFAAWLDRVHAASVEMQLAQDAPFESIVAAVKPERQADRPPLAQVMVDYQELPLPTRWNDGLTCRPLLHHRGATQFDLSLLVIAFPDHHEFAIEYRSNLFLESSARTLLDRLVAFLDHATREPDTRLPAIDTLTETDRHWLTAAGKGPARPEWPLQTTAALIAAQTRRTPLNTAVTGHAGSLDYAALDRLSTSLAACLRDLGVERGHRVAVLLDRDHRLPAALLAVWKAGATYVPLDPHNPPARIAAILADQSPVHLWVAPAFLQHLPEGCRGFHLDPAHPPPATDPDFQPVSPLPTDPAYLLHTSGSTGQPKGVVVPHGALANFLLSMAESPGITEHDRLPAITTISFDISALEIFLPLVVGASVEILPAGITRHGQRLRDHLHSGDFTIIQATPATWRILLDAGWTGHPKLRLLCGGEALDPALAAELTSCGRELWNLYGPTETTVWSTVWKVPHGANRISIGKPVANTTVLVAGPDGETLPPAAIGELWIGGAGLATGYWRRDEITRDRFVIRNHQRFYRTGDLARWLPDATLECLGRLDNQIKIRGHRIELGEIEAVLATHPDVSAAAVVTTGTGHQTKLVAFVTTRRIPADPSALLAFLRSRLPSHMIPGAIHPVADFPLTSSGKVDRRALSRLDPDIPPPRIEPVPAIAEQPLLAEIIPLWQAMLENPRVSPSDNFFDLGGHSLLASRLVAEASRRLAVPVALDWFFADPTPEGMARQIHTHAARDLAQPRVVPLAAGPDTRPLFWVHTLVDGGMGLLPYREAARHLADVAHSRGLADGSIAFDSLAALAACHVRNLRSVQPEGPYRLAGFCFGGNLAAEIAAQLHAQGERIELLALLESQPPGMSRSLADVFHPSAWANILPRVPRRAARFIRFDLPTAMRRVRIKQRAAAGSIAAWWKSDPDRIPNIGSILDIDALDPADRARAESRWITLHRHTPRVPPADRVVLVRAQDDGWWPRPDALGWNNLSPVPVEQFRVSGDHESFLRGQSAAEVAAILKPFLTHSPSPDRP